MGKLELKTKLWSITPEDAEENIPSDMQEQGLRSIWRVRPRKNGTECVGEISFILPVHRGTLEMQYRLLDDAVSAEDFAQAVGVVASWGLQQKDIYKIRVMAEPEDSFAESVFTSLKFTKKTKGEKVYYDQERAGSAWMSIYMCFGLSIGLALGSSFDHNAIGMCLGMSIGMLIGVLLDQNEKKHRKEVTGK